MNTPTDSSSDARLLMETVRAFVRRFSIAERSDIACCGFSVAQAATLEALHDREPVRLGDLGRRLGIAASTLTRNLVRLKERGLVVSAADPTDGRASVVRLTADGRRAAEDVKRQEEGFFELVIEHLPPEDRGKTLGTILNLWTAVRFATESCCPGAFDHLMHNPARPGMKGTENVCKTC